MQDGRYDSGCPALAESYRLDPKPGALFTLAECEAMWGKIASAVAHYDDYLRMLDRLAPDQRASQHQREGVATAKRLELAPKVPTLEIQLSPATSPDATVKRDGAALAKVALRVPLPLDPGEHVLVIEDPSGARQETKVTLVAGEKKVVTLDLPPLPSKPAPVAKTEAPGPTPAGGRSKAWTYVAFGTAAVAAGVGGVTGALVFGKKSTIDQHCVDVACNREGKDAADAAQTLGLVSTISFAVAVVAAGTGLALVWTDPGTQRSVAIAPGAIAGSW